MREGKYRDLDMRIEEVVWRITCGHRGIPAVEGPWRSDKLEQNLHEVEWSGEVWKGSVGIG